MKKILYILSVATLMFSCSDFKIYNTPYPNSSLVDLSVDWSILHDGDTAPAEYAILQSGVVQTSSEEVTTFVFDPNTDVDFLIYNLPSGITITDGVASLDEATRTAATDPEPLPGHLYYGTGSATLVEVDNIVDVTIIAQRATAPLTIKLDYVQSEIPNISTTTVELTGIIVEKDLWSGEMVSSATLTQYPELDDSADLLTLTYNIMGVDLSTSQVLTITYTTTDDQTLTVTSDLTELLADFNNTMEGLSLEGDMSLPTDLDVTGSINGWGEGDNDAGSAI